MVKDRVASVTLGPMDKASTRPSTSGSITQQQGFSEVTDITSPAATAKWDARMVERKMLNVSVTEDTCVTSYLLALHVMSYRTPHRIEQKSEPDGTREILDQNIKIYFGSKGMTPHWSFA